jgi:hypothetical protein
MGEFIQPWRGMRWYHDMGNEIRVFWEVTKCRLVVTDVSERLAIPYSQIISARRSGLLILKVNAAPTFAIQLFPTRRAITSQKKRIFVTTALRA